MRVPYLIRWPGRTAPGATCAVPVTGTDFYPTILDIAGLPLRPNQHRDGVSLVPVLKGGTLPERPLFWHYPHYGNQGGIPGCSIRNGDWKLIEFFEGGVVLFNLAEDISERHDRSSSEPERAATMLAELHAWQEEAGAIKPKLNPDWKPWRDKDLDPLV